MDYIKNKIGDYIEKENLIILLKDKKFNKNITKLKKIMNLARSNSNILFKHSKSLTDDDLINYLMRCINDPNSSMNKDKKNNNLNYSIYSNLNHLNSLSLKNIIDESNKQKLKELSSNSLYYINNNNNINNNKNQNFKEKFEKKIKNENKKKLKFLMNENSKEENNNNNNNNNNHNKYSLNYSIFNDEIQFKNEIKFRIENAKDEESKKKFQEFLEKLEQMKKMNNKDYVNFVLNINSYKMEFNELINNRNMEERINKFLDKFYTERELIKNERKYKSEKISVREYKFKSFLEKSLCK